MLCSSCGKKVSKSFEVLTPEGEHYHTTCFKCTPCSNTLFCTKDHSPRLGAYCRKQLSPFAFEKQQGELYCSACVFTNQSTTRERNLKDKQDKEKGENKSNDEKKQDDDSNEKGDKTPACKDESSDQIDVHSTVCNLEAQPNVRVINLSSKNIGTLPDYILGLSNLQELHLACNQLTSLPEGLGKLSSLRVLALADNHLASLPEGLGKLSSLTKLGISDNQLKSLPKSLGDLSSLTTLLISKNMLESLPTTIAQLTSLKTLDLSNNKLSCLPNEIGQLASLTSLNLETNELREVPESLGQLSSLKILMLSSNNLAILPESLGLLKLTDLTYGSNPGIQLPAFRAFMPRKTREGKSVIANLPHRDDLRKDWLTGYVGQPIAKERMQRLLGRLKFEQGGNVLLFFGPPGVGKTEMAQRLARELDRGFIGIDMSSCQKASDLVGAEKGLVGQEHGLLTAQLLDKPNAVVLLDEVEKANVTPEILSSLLGAFEGRLQDKLLRKCECKQSVWLLGCNLASTVLKESDSANFRKHLSDPVLYEEWKKAHLDPLLERFQNPEGFLQRISEFIPFLPFDERERQQVATEKLKRLRISIFKTHGLCFSWSAEVAQYIAEGYQDGARYNIRERGLKDQLGDNWDRLSKNEGNLIYVLLQNQTQEVYVFGRHNVSYDYTALQQFSEQDLTSEVVMNPDLVALFEEIPSLTPKERHSYGLLFQYHKVQPADFTHYTRAALEKMGISKVGSQVTILRHMKAFAERKQRTTEIQSYPQQEKPSTDDFSKFILLGVGIVILMGWLQSLFCWAKQDR